MRSRWLHVITQRSPPSVSLAGFVFPGGYLLSRDLSSDYHRRADVSLPGSEWDRVGPSGYDHQVAGKCFVLTYSLHRVSGWSCCRMLCCCCLRQSLALCCKQQADIRVAGGCGLITISFAFELTLCFESCISKLITGGDASCLSCV